MIHINFLGGAREVGRSAILIDTDTEKFIWDYGIEVQEGKTPIKPNLNLDAVFLTHAHLDHSGFAPNLYKRGYTGNIYATPPTISLCSLLLKDSIKVQKKKGMISGFSTFDIKKMEKRERFFGFDQRMEFGSSTIEFIYASHIPGAASILLEAKDKRILYTGDVKFIDTKLMKGVSMDIKDIEVLISEATYSYKDHPDRNELEDRLKTIIQETVYNNGIALLPAFAVGRTQELLLILADLGLPIYLDGMGIEATQRTLLYPKSIRDAEKLRKIFNRVHKIKRNSERAEIIEKPCIIITTAGMLSGGPIGFYMKNLWQRKDCSLILTGYQVENTPGRMLLETGKYINESIDVKPRMHVEFLDFSAHVDRDHLLKFYNKVSPEKILLMHGDRAEEFAAELKGKGFDAYAPRNGEKIRV